MAITARGKWTTKEIFNEVVAGNWITLLSTGMYTVGTGGSGRLGLGNTTAYSTFKQVGSLSTWSNISIKTFGLAVKSDGTLWSWGGNYSGQLGLGNTTYYSSPKQVGALTAWSTVSCGSIYSLAVKSDGTLWSWGAGIEGQLGSGNTLSRSSPVQVGALTTWLKVVASGYRCSLAIKTDGTLWSWGKNNSGQLGLGNITYYSSPKQVGASVNWIDISGGQNCTIALTY